MNKRDELDSISIKFRKQLYEAKDQKDQEDVNEDFKNLNNKNYMRNRRSILNYLQDALTYLGYISYDDDWKKHEDEAIKLQVGIEKLLKKLK